MLHFNIKSIPIFLFLFFASKLLAQSKQPLVSDFRISKDSKQSTFIQNNPYLFTNNDHEFIVAWEDYRLGDKNYFAQRFDSLGNKRGKNFRVKSNSIIVINPNSEFLNISIKQYYDDILGGGSIEYYYSLFDEQNNLIVSENFIQGASIPWCGTGYFGLDAKACNAANGFLFGLRNNTDIFLTKLNLAGNIEYYYALSDSINSHSILNFDLNASKKNFLITWFALNGNIYEPSDTASLNFTVINENSLSQPKNFRIKNFILDKDYYYFDDTFLLIKSVFISDTTFLIFDLSRDSLTLNFRKFNINGQRLTQDSSISLVNNFNKEELYTYFIRKFDISQMKDGGFLLYISIDSSYTTVNNIVFNFNSDGDLKTVFREETTNKIGFGGKPFILSDNELLITRSTKNDVFLVKYNLFNFSDSLKINDDLTGSNDIKPLVTSINNSKYFVSWNNEKGNYGRIINEDGTLQGEQVKLDGKFTLFLNEDVPINFWKKKILNNNSIIGYTIYDGNWNFIKQDTLDKGDYYSLASSAIKLSDTTFCVLTRNDKQAKLRLLNRFGELKKGIVLSDSDYTYPTNLFKENKNKFWAKWGNNLQLFDNNLNAINSIYKNEGTYYLGNNKFLQIHTKYDVFPPYLIGTIFSATGDTLVGEFKLVDIAMGNFSDETKVIPMNQSKFIILFSNYDSNGKLNKYWRIYNVNGEAEYNKYKIHQSEATKTKNISASINNDKIFFTWADLRNGNLGYDIYGNIYNINTITAVNEIKENELPKKFVLFQNYPNPFNPATTIKYSIPSLGTGRELSVRLEIYDVLGREVAILVNKKQNPGVYKVEFNASELTSGVYFYRLKLYPVEGKAGGFFKTRKMLLLR